MTPTETRKSSGFTDRDREDQDQLLARLRQYSMTKRLKEGHREKKRRHTQKRAMELLGKIIVR